MKKLIITMIAIAFSLSAFSAEVNLLGQNVNSYTTKDGGFPTLLDNLAKIKGLGRIRYTSPHPKDINDINNNLLQLHAELQKLSSFQLRHLATYHSEIIIKNHDFHTFLYVFTRTLLVPALARRPATRGRKRPAARPADLAEGSGGRSSQRREPGEDGDRATVLPFPRDSQSQHARPAGCQRARSAENILVGQRYTG